MQRYFVEFNPLDKFIFISGDDYHHIKNVMRMNLNDEFYVSNGEKVFVCKIVLFEIDKIKCELLYEVKTNSELNINVTIAQGMPKSDKFELVIQKTTELGVGELIPVLCDRSIVKIVAKNKDKKLKRFEKIAKEAAEQCHRLRIPKINDFMNINQLIKYSKKIKYKLVAYEASNSQDDTNYKNILKNLKVDDDLIIFIGPEGGISEKELELLVINDFKIISLGPRILRTETAPIFIMSTISYELELKG